MAQLGVQIVTAQSTTPSPPPWNTGNAFMVGFTDWGPVSQAVGVQSQANLQVAIGPRSSTNATVYDSADIYMRENGTSTAAVFISRVVGPSASAASLTISDTNPSATHLINADYVGAYGNALQVAINNTGGAYTVTLTDTFGNTIATSPSLTTRAAATAWAASTGYITMTPFVGSSLPKTITATSLTGGTDDRAHTTITSWTNALNAIPLSLGPGQVCAPGQTNTTLNGIWAALAAHATANNRCAIADMDDNVTANAEVADIGATFNTIPASPIGFWAGNLSAPGITPGTTRNIPPSAVIAALCARVDTTGNPNLPAAGTGYQTVYCTGPWSLVSGTFSTYSDNDIQTLNSAGINAFRNVFGNYENYGFVSSVLPTTDQIFWQFNHFRLKMAITSIFYQVAEPYVFSQLDGQGFTLTAFSNALVGGLTPLYNAGALYGSTPQQAFAVDVGSTVNPPGSLQSGNLQAIVGVRMSPFAQLVTITLDTFPITQQINV